MKEPATMATVLLFFSILATIALIEFIIRAAQCYTCGEFWIDIQALWESRNDRLIP